MKLKNLLDGFSISATVYNLLLEMFWELNGTSPKVALSGHELLHPDQRVSLLKAYHLWKKLEQHYDASDLGIAMARRLTPSRANLIGSLFMETRNLKESVTMMSRYLSIAADNVMFHYHEEGAQAVFTFTLSPRALLPYSVTEFYMFTCCFWAMQYAGLENLPVIEADFDFKQPPHVDRYRQISPDARIRFGQKQNAIRLDRSMFYVENANYSSYLQDLILQHTDKLMQSYRDDHSMSQVVLTCIQQRLPESTPSIEEIADELCLSPRTLSRRLNEEGEQFRHLLDMAKKETAGSMIDDRGLRIEEIAYLLGYNEYSSFSRAFKKWYGVSPMEFRKNNHG